MSNLSRDHDDPGNVGLRRYLIFLLVALGASGCSAPREDPSTEIGREAIFQSVDNALTIKDCQTAIADIEPVYNSQYTSHHARQLRAAAHGCHLGINFFSLLGEIATTDLTGSNFWPAMAQFFPSTLGDTKTESSWYATDALQADVKAGTVFTPSLEINSTTYNPGSLVASDHEDDANVYLTLVSMGTIGTLEWRYGNPNPVTYKKGNALPWDDYTKVDTNGCSYVAAMLNILDALQAIQSATQGSHLSQALSAVITLKTVLFDPGCAAGCTACATVTCTACPSNLRYRDACTPVGTKTVENCAVAGLVNAINTDPTYGWQ